MVSHEQQLFFVTTTHSLALTHESCLEITLNENVRDSHLLAFSAINGRSQELQNCCNFYHGAAPPYLVVLPHAQQQSERRHLCTTPSKDTIQAPIQRCRRFYQNCSFQRGRNRQAPVQVQLQHKSLTLSLSYKDGMLSQRRGQQL